MSRLIGRDFELVHLADAVARARAGVRTVVVLEGDAGMGKSRLVGEALASYRDPEDAVAVAYGVELAGAEIPYRATTDLMRTLCRDIGVDAVRAAAGWYAPALRPLLPGLAAGGDAEASPARVLPALVWTLEQLAADRLVWLVVEDLPWLDGPTRDLLAYLVRVVQPSQLLLLVTVRTHDPAADPAVGDLVDSWMSLDGVTRIEIPPLEPDEVAELVGAITGETATRAQVDRVSRAGNGSPLLTEQLVAAGLDDSDAAAVLEDPMLARIRRLDPDTLRLVQLAALGEGHLEHRLLALVYAAPEATFDAAVDRALQVRLLQYRPEEREFTFAHPLLRKAAEATLSPGERMRGHRRWAEALSTAGEQRGERRLLIAAAYHWAGTDDDAETLTTSLRAARETTRLGAATETADLLLRAWNLWDLVPNAGDLADRARDDLFLDLADVLQAADQLVDTVPIIDRELERTLSDPHRDRMRVLCLRLFAGDSRELVGEPADESLYAEALASADDLLVAPANRLLIPALNTLGWQVQWSDVDLADRLFDRGLAVSLEAGSQADIAFTAAQVARQRSARGLHDEALAVCASALETCRSVADYMGVERVRGNALAVSGRLRAGLAQLDRTLARLPDPQLARTDWTHTAVNAANWRISLGDWEEAAALLGECQKLDVDEWATGTWVMTSASEFACLRGEVDKAAQLAESAQQRLGPEVESVWGLVRDPVWMALARIAAIRGDYAQAHQWLEPMLRRPGKSSGATMWPMVGMAAEIEGDRAASTADRASAVQSHRAR